MIVRYREDPTAAILAVAAIVLLAATLAFMLLAPRPQGPTRAQQIDAQNKLKLEIAVAQKTLAESRAYNLGKTWAGSQDDIAPGVLARVTQVARSQGLRLVSLRPQRVDDKSVPPMIPFLAVVEGPYASAVNFARQMETPQTRLAVTLIQVTSSDAATDKVTASVGLAAFMTPQRMTTTPSESRMGATGA